MALQQRRGAGLGVSAGAVPSAARATVASSPTHAANATQECAALLESDPSALLAKYMEFVSSKFTSMNGKGARPLSRAACSRAPQARPGVFVFVSVADLRGE